MAIKLEVKPYCATCCDFEADVTKPERTVILTSDSDNRPCTKTVQTDTVIRCKYARRCEAILRYLHQATPNPKDEVDA